MLKIPAPKSFATIPAANAGDVFGATQYNCADNNTRIPTVIARAVSANGTTITGAELFRVSPTAGRRMRALAELLGHWWANNPESDWGGVIPAFSHASGSGTICWYFAQAGDVRIELRHQGSDNSDPTIAIIEAPVSGPITIDVSGYHRVWSTSGWLDAKPKSAADWCPAGDGRMDVNAWSWIPRILKALGVTQHPFGGVTPPWATPAQRLPHVIGALSWYTDSLARPCYNVDPRKRLVEFAARLDDAFNGKVLDKAVCDRLYTAAVATVKGDTEALWREHRAISESLKREAARPLRARSTTR